MFIDNAHVVYLITIIIILNEKLPQAFMQIE